jgi:hypothetical protein
MVATGRTMSSSRDHRSMDTGKVRSSREFWSAIEVFRPFI